MKLFWTIVGLGVVAAAAAYAGNLDVLVPADPAPEEAAPMGGSSAAWIVPLLAILVIAAAAGSDDDSTTSN